MKIKGGNEGFVYGHKIAGTPDNWHLNFGKWKGKDGSEVPPSYLQWMLSEMSLTAPEEKLIRDILGGGSSNVGGKAKKAQRKPLAASMLKDWQKADIQAHCIDTAPPKPYPLDSAAEARIEKLETKIKALNGKMLAMHETLMQHNKKVFPKEEDAEHKKIMKALDEFEKKLPKKKAKKKTTKKKK
jgi:hypothetical protein